MSSAHARNIEAVESMILDRLAALPEGAEELVDSSIPLLERLNGEEREALTALMIEGLADADLPQTAWRVMETASLWIGNDALPRKRLAEIARAAIAGGKAEVGALVDASALATEEEPVARAVERLRKLRAFAPGVVCRHASWGFGIIREVHAIQGEVEVDFESKPRHLLQLRFAADSVETFPEGHVLSRRALDLEALQKDAKSDPGTFLRSCLRDAGGVLATGEILDWLKGRVIPDDEWSRWWTAARTAVRNDPYVVVPQRRTDPWHLSERAVGPGEIFDQAIARAGGVYEILVAADDFLKAHSEEFSEQRRENVRAALAQRGQGARQARDIAMAVVLGPSGVLPHAEFEAAIGELLKPEGLIEAARSIPAVRFVRAVDQLWQARSEQTRHVVAAAINEFPTRAVAVVIPFLVERVPHREVGEMIAQVIGEGSVEAEILIWVVSDAARAEGFGIRMTPLIARRALAAIERPHSGDRRRAQRELADLLTKQDVLQPLIREASHAEIETLVSLITKSESLGLLLQRSLLASLVKLRPEAAELLASAPSRSQAPSADVCSVRTHRRLQSELRKIVEVDVPANSREINEALSHGDLRENHQYEAAKEQQAVLSRRRAELETLLERLRPSDFADAATDSVRPGTTVVLNVPGGEARRVHVLGVHDSDPDRGAVASDTPVGQALMSRRPGDAVTLPGDGTTTVAEVTAIERLPADLAAWLTPSEL